LFFYLGQHALLRLPRVGGDDPRRPADGQEGDGTGTAVQRPGAAELVQVPQQQHRAGVPVGQPLQRLQGLADARLAAVGDVRPEERHDRVEHEQPGPGRRDDFVEDAAVGGQAQRPGVRVQARDEHARQVGAEGLQPRQDGVLRVVLTVQDDGTGGLRTGNGWVIPAPASRRSL
jgi:hypothetical protein